MKELAKHLSERDSNVNPEESCRDNIKSAAETVDNVQSKVSKRDWISATSSALVGARRLIPAVSDHDEERKHLKCKLMKSLRIDGEQWWAKKASERGKAQLVVNIR
ncbi:unnamed protein product [Heterobilharzia americana]|nr:unnamed protein product [Heterobilharzia americana]